MGYVSTRNGGMSSRPTADASFECITVQSRSCPRKLKPGQVKRYMSKGPLFGYMIACPSCGFIEMHEHKKAQFIEQPDPENPDRPIFLVGTTNALRCMLCNRDIAAADGKISAATRVSTAAE